jgi:hypothetical protein
MLTSEPVAFCEFGTLTGPLTDTNDPAPVGALDVTGGTIPLDEPWSTDAGVSTLTSLPAAWLPLDWLGEPCSTDEGASTLTSVPLPVEPLPVEPLPVDWPEGLGSTDVGASTLTSVPLPVEPLPVDWPEGLCPTEVGAPTLTSVPLPVVLVFPEPVGAVLVPLVGVPVPDGVSDAIAEVGVVVVPVVGDETPSVWLADTRPGVPDAVDVPEPAGPATHEGGLVDAAGFADARTTPKRMPPNPKMPIPKKRRNSVNIFCSPFCPVDLIHFHENQPDDYPGGGARASKRNRGCLPPPGYTSPTPSNGSSALDEGIPSEDPWPEDGDPPAVALANSGNTLGSGSGFFGTGCTGA